MNLPLFIAKRYLFAGKSHNVINVISAISAAGMAIGTAAVILILSVYNGFDKIIEDNLSRLDPDVLVVNDGAPFTPDEVSSWKVLANRADVLSVSERVSETVFVTYGEAQSVARSRGVDSVFEAANGLHLYRGDVPLCIVGSALASSLGVNPAFVDPLVMWYPDRYAEIDPMKPMSALKQEKVFAQRILSSGGADSDLILMPIEVLRSLLGRCGETDAVEIRLADSSEKGVKRFISGFEALPEGVRLLDRHRQNPGLYKMMRYEKLAIFLILIFVVIIIGFNIFGSLSMLIIEKRDDIATLKSLGAADKEVRKVFVFEGWMITLCGLAVGLVLGTGLSLAQQHFGLVKMPGNYLMSSYPSVLQWTDVAVTAVCVALIGWVIAALTAGKRFSACP